MLYCNWALLIALADRAKFDRARGQEKITSGEEVAAVGRLPSGSRGEGGATKLRSQLTAIYKISAAFS